MRGTHHSCPAPGPVCNTVTHRGLSPTGGRSPGVQVRGGAWGTPARCQPPCALLHQQGMGPSSGQGWGGSRELLRAVSSCEPVPGVSRELCKAHVSVQCLLRSKPSPAARTACPGAAGHRSGTVTLWRGDGLAGQANPPLGGHPLLLPPVPRSDLGEPRGPTASVLVAAGPLLHPPTPAPTAPAWCGCGGDLRLSACNEGGFFP